MPEAQPAADNAHSRAAVSARRLMSREQHNQSLGTPASAGRRGASPVCGLVSLSGSEGFGQLSSGADVELVVGRVEVCLDGLYGQKELLGDLAVGEASGGHLRNPPLTGGQALDPDGDEARQLLAGSPELAVGALGEREGAAAPGELEAGAQRLPGVPSVAGSPQHGPEVGEGARVLEPGGRAFEQPDGFAQQFGAPISAFHDPAGGQRGSDGPGG